MLEKNRIYGLNHAGGSQDGVRWPVIYCGKKHVVIGENEGDPRCSGTYQAFVYLQSTQESNYRLAQAWVRESNLAQKGEELAILNPTEVMYSTGEGPTSGIAEEERDFLLQRLIQQHNEKKTLPRNRNVFSEEEATH